MSMQLVSSLMAFFSILFPARIWYPPSQPLTISVKAENEVTLVLTEFTGRVIAPTGPADVTGGKAVEVNLKTIYPEVTRPGTYILYAKPKDKPLEQFVGTPLVIGVRADRQPGINEPAVTKVEPLRYAVMTTDHGKMTLAFYYDVAPNTVDSFLTLSSEGFYDGLTFHRIVPDFVVQGGDPLGSGHGGPGFQIDAEFNDRKHEEGVLSMARTGDPLEAQMKPRHEYANSAGSQFFICLVYRQHLDGRYTAFGKVVEGNDAYRSMAKVPLADARAGRPQKPPVIEKVEVKAVTAENNPYRGLFAPANAK